MSFFFSSGCDTIAVLLQCSFGFSFVYCHVFLLFLLSAGECHYRCGTDREKGNLSLVRSEVWGQPQGLLSPHLLHLGHNTRVASVGLNTPSLWASQSSNQYIITKGPKCFMYHSFYEKIRDIGFYRELYTHCTELLSVPRRNKVCVLKIAIFLFVSFYVDQLFNLEQTMHEKQLTSQIGNSKRKKLNSFHRMFWQFYVFPIKNKSTNNQIKRCILLCNI